jgi:hypothetical protein
VTAVRPCVRWSFDVGFELGELIDLGAHGAGDQAAHQLRVRPVEAGSSAKVKVMRTAQGPFPMETTYTWQPVDLDRTRMTCGTRGEPAGFARVTAPVIAAAMGRANQKDLANLKRILEGSR